MTNTHPESAQTAQEEVISFLSRPEAYGFEAGEVERIDTHISVVFLVGDHAYKLKRAVKFPYLDFSTEALRRRFCEAEVEINRRTAPELYERTIPVTRDAGGRLALGGTGEPVDWLVVMKRFDQTCLLDRLAERGALGEDLIVRLADAVSDFHRAAAAGPASGGAAAMRRTVEGSLAEIERHVPAPFDAAVAARFGSWLRDELSRREGLLDRRAETGFVRRCHGDLHLRNVYLRGDVPTPFDAIEFDERIGTIDTLYDYAFLVMDLVHREMPAEANLALNRYLQRTDDYHGLSALRLFFATRASVKAHTTASAAARQEVPAETERYHAEARDYLALGLRFLEPVKPELVALGGFSGSGKSTLARLLAPRLGGPAGAIVIHSDVVRKSIFGVVPEEQLPAEAYTEDVSRQVYELMRAQAGEALGAGIPAIVDGTFMNAIERRKARELAVRCGVPFAGLWLDVPENVLAHRVETRGADASDADRRVLEGQLTADIGELDWPRIGAREGKPETLHQAFAALGLDEFC
jgi:aminoglycoside phosphotransferase family enzyme